MLKLFSVTLLLLSACTSVIAQKVNIIPQPTSITEKEGFFTITPKTAIIAQTKDEIKSANFLNEYLKNCYGFILPVKPKGTTGIIIKAAIVLKMATL
ncbi:glycoside hydrolase family 20 zincin-like fold domain-containing protein [Niabella hibiscisoli]|uniref:glycoside hydrolase family 20 zincin-like fold domain-containing protein n=1 Tax=Niabella hibiscisoli TaxID=1825928 RepID=UPI0021D458AD|nr:glycoside hydrolase family 20 zincin-like fold domain-containing protein [Niabella hibiscisoli]